MSDASPDTTPPSLTESPKTSGAVSAMIAGNLIAFFVVPMAMCTCGDLPPESIPVAGLAAVLAWAGWWRGRPGKPVGTRLFLLILATPLPTLMLAKAIADAQHAHP